MRPIEWEIGFGVIEARGDFPPQSRVAGTAVLDRHAAGKLPLMDIFVASDALRSRPTESDFLSNARTRRFMAGQTIHNPMCAEQGKARRRVVEPQGGSPGRDRMTCFTLFLRNVQEVGVSMTGNARAVTENVLVRIALVFPMAIGTRHRQVGALQIESRPFVFSQGESRRGEARHRMARFARVPICRQELIGVRVLMTPRTGSESRMIVRRAPPLLVTILAGHRHMLAFQRIAGGHMRLEIERGGFESLLHTVA